MLPWSNHPQNAVNVLSWFCVPRKHALRLTPSPTVKGWHLVDLKGFSERRCILIYISSWAMNVCIWKDSLLQLCGERTVKARAGAHDLSMSACHQKWNAEVMWTNISHHPREKWAAEGDKQKAESPGGSQIAWDTRAGENSLLTCSHFYSLFHSFWHFFFKCRPVKLNTTLKVTLRKPKATGVFQEETLRSSELPSFLVFPQPTISRVAWHGLL